MKAVGPLCHAKISVRVASVRGDLIPFLRWMTSHLKLLVGRGAGIEVLLLALWTSLAVNAATLARRLRPNGPRSRVTRSIPCTGQAREAVEPLWITARQNDLVAPASDPGVAGFPSCPLRLTCSGIVVGGFVATHHRLTVSPPAPARGPPFVSRSLI